MKDTVSRRIDRFKWTNRKTSDKVNYKLAHISLIISFNQTFHSVKKYNTQNRNFIRYIISI